MVRLMLLSLFLCAQSAVATFLPPNKLHLEMQTQAANMTREEFNEISSSVIRIYAPEVAKFGRQLVLNADWDNATVNASASQIGTQWAVNMYGGLARRPEVTPDGFALVVCHEVGHHMAGFPFYAGRWAASEGESDYFATRVCGKRLWAGADNSSVEVDELAAQRCAAAYTTVPERALCGRVAMAGKSLAALLSRLGNSPVPEFGTPDRNVVARTVPSHPTGQCRLDSYFAGSLCTAKFRNGVIPGKDNPNGQDSKFAEFDALAVSCAARPRCWFAPL